MATDGYWDLRILHLDRKKWSALSPYARWERYCEWLKKPYEPTEPRGENPTFLLTYYIDNRGDRGSEEAYMLTDLNRHYMSRRKKWKIYKGKNATDALTEQLFWKRMG